MNDLTNQRFDRLIALCPTGRLSNGGIIWRCKCDCGNFTEVQTSHLSKGRTKSCGCLQKERMSEAMLKHGDAIHGKRPKVYNVWLNMKNRCANPKNQSYKYYGGRGISVYKEWISNYQAFKFWALLNGYADNLTIDRIDHYGNYEPNNCRWITQSENTRKSNIKRKGIKYNRSFRNE